MRITETIEPSYFIVAAFGFIILSFIQYKKFGKMDFKKFHPAGSLGSQLKTVEDIMIKGNSIPFVNENTKMEKALKILSGDAKKKYTDLRSRLLKILSNIEAKIDFPEEDLPEDILKNIKIETKDIISLINNILNDGRTGEKIRDGFKISILGPTNAGKSTLLNYLSKREVAIVSNIEGTTRDLIEVSLNLDGYPVIITDTAGLRETSDEIESRGVELALKSAKNADLKIILLDAKNPYFSSFLDNINDENSILVLNKSDCLSLSFASSFFSFFSSYFFSEDLMTRPLSKSLSPLHLGHSLQSSSLP